MIGTYNSGSASYPISINTYSPKKSLPLTGNGKYGTCDKDYIHIAICDSQSINQSEA